MADDKTEDQKRDEARRKALTAAGIGVGLGSAALAAALLYARSGRAKAGDDQPPKTSTAPKTPIQEGDRWTD